MNTPICDFVRRYAEKQSLRLHMPGHKGAGILGVEALDITEIDGADSLYEANGIIRQSEQNASALFGCETFYSTEGSSQCIRAMLYLSILHARLKGQRPLIAAGRNAHKTFLSAAALLDFDVLWLYPPSMDSYLSCAISAEALESTLSACSQPPAAVYLTCPDYLGHLSDLRSIADVCHRHGVLLLVDNAHGAYLKFLPESLHPIDLGADLCCDSAHKTLPVLTGGAYLHLSHQVSRLFSHQAKNALALFGSTSPSYLILQSLDAANAALAHGYSSRLADFVWEMERFKARLQSKGHLLAGQEPLKITLHAKPCGYTGLELARLLEERGIVCEFCDPDFVVLMFTPETGRTGLARVEDALASIPPKPAISLPPPGFHPCRQILSIREAALSFSETVPVEKGAGRILAAASVGCPPAVPIVICGELIDSQAIERFAYYGIKTLSVVAEP